MSKNALVIRLGNEDRENIVISKDVKSITNIPFFNDSLAYDQRIRHEQILKKLKQGNLQASELAIDLLILAVAVFAADIRISRDTSQDSWTREIVLFIPVSDVDLWVKKIGLVETMLCFLTGDRWNIVFRPRPQKMKSIAPVVDRKVKFNSNTLSLFSGGLDSYIGAIDLLANKKPLMLLGHHKSPDVIVPQQACYQGLKTFFLTQDLEFLDIYLNIPKKIFNSEEKTERSRSFLFLSLGTLFASTLNEKSHLIVPENGLISLNVPLTPLRLGSLSTKTTHPYFLDKFQELIDSLNLKVDIFNPYRFKTKGEMLAECINTTVLNRNSHLTMSCAHPTAARWFGQSSGHCGECVPCIIRQAAFHKANIEDKTIYKSKKLSTKYPQVKAFNYSIFRLSNNPSIANELIFKSGPLIGHLDQLNQFSEVYKRGMTEVAEFFSSRGIK
jgi:hypothetical protein